jgi:hypothetical protein
MSWFTAGLGVPDDFAIVGVDGVEIVVGGGEEGAVAEDGGRGRQWRLDPAMPDFLAVAEIQGGYVGEARGDDQLLASDREAAADGVFIPLGVGGLEFVLPHALAGVDVEGGHDLIAVDRVDAASLGHGRGDNALELARTFAGADAPVDLELLAGGQMAGNLGCVQAGLRPVSRRLGWRQRDGGRRERRIGDEVFRERVHRDARRLLFFREDDRGVAARREHCGHRQGEDEVTHH